MIRLPARTPEATVVGQLRDWQADVDREPDYAARVDLAERHFAARNRRDNETFKAVRATLTGMCSGARRCGYCEDSAADEVEHIWPKSLYPERVFVWENYLYACGTCNGPKGNQFAVLPAGTLAPVSVARRRHAPVAPPAAGDAALIDPRREDPLEFLDLDLCGTFYFTPRTARGTREFVRADYTIRLLGLNERDYLRQARAEAFDSYRARLGEYVTERNAGAPAARLQRRVTALQRMQHPTVWREMQRQCAALAELQVLFTDAPEALGW